MTFRGPDVSLLLIPSRLLVGFVPRFHFKVLDTRVSIGAAVGFEVKSGGLHRGLWGNEGEANLIVISLRLHSQPQFVELHTFKPPQVR